MLRSDVWKKKILGLRVVGEDRRPIGLKASLVRNALRIVDAFPASLYLLGLVFIRKRGARFGDLVAKTKVIEEKRKFAIGWPSPKRDGFARSRVFVWFVWCRMLCSRRRYGREEK